MFGRTYSYSDVREHSLMDIRNHRCWMNALYIVNEIFQTNQSQKKSVSAEWHQRSTEKKLLDWHSEKAEEAHIYIF
jgi:hypothetical protein